MFLDYFSCLFLSQTSTLLKIDVTFSPKYRIEQQTSKLKVTFQGIYFKNLIDASMPASSPSCSSSYSNDFNRETTSSFLNIFLFLCTLYSGQNKIFDPTMLELLIPFKSVKGASHI